MNTSQTLINRFIIFILFTMFACHSNDKKLKEERSRIQKNTNSQKYAPEWESLKKHKTPDWFLDAKFGIYCHWGPYSVPAFENEWYAHWMYTNERNPEYKRGKTFYDHHIKTYGNLKDFGYKDFIPRFKAEKFDPVKWADLFQKSGAKFAGPVSEHADGFAMWDSDLTRWNAKNMGPRRDVLGELAKEIRKRDMKFIATFHRQWLYAWFPTWDESTDASDPAFADLYGPRVNKGDFVYPETNFDNKKDKYYPLADSAFNTEWYNRLKEIVDKYDPDLVWFDNKMDIIGEDYRKNFLAYYYNQAIKKEKEVVVTYKFEDLKKGTAVLDLERARMSESQPFHWLTDDSIDWKSWSHIDNPEYKSTNRVIDFLVDVVSKNGCLLLNIPPKADGSIPIEVEKRLIEIGEWLSINGEAIYQTRPWKIYGEGDTKVVEGHLSERKNSGNTSNDIRFTKKGNTLYAIFLDWPKTNKLKIKSLGTNAGLLEKEIRKINLIGFKQPLQYSIDEQNLTVELPKQKIGKHAFVLKIFHFYD